jgi:hypothetical protein
MQVLALLQSFMRGEKKKVKANAKAEIYYSLRNGDTRNPSDENEINKSAIDIHVASSRWVAAVDAAALSVRAKLM